MPFTLNFNSNENNEKLDIQFLEELGLCNSQSIDTISFDTHFNKPIPRLPDYIKHIKFGYYFTQDISNIGDHIECLEFSVANFNYNLASFPKNMKKLVICADNILSKIDNVPNSLENLKIQCSTFKDVLMLDNCNLQSLTIYSNSFNHPLSCLPATLKELIISCQLFNKEINNLPSGLEYLKLSSKFYNQKMDNLPPHLTKLILEEMEIFRMPLDNLPESIEILDLDFGYERISKYKYNITNLSNCKKLRIANYWGDLNQLPDSVEELDIWYPPNKSRNVREYITHWIRFPSNLKKLDINREMVRMNRIHDMTDIIRGIIKCDGICINGIF
jgi:hypothetical protein